MKWQHKVMTKNQIASETPLKEHIEHTVGRFTECKEQGRSTYYLSGSCIGNAVEGETW